jgi:glutamate-1-semialdehyde 2,1-aminomutase
MSQGQRIWEKAQRLIPNGNSLLSKNPDMFLPKFWPSYFSKSKGCSIWDLDGKKYVDMSVMGIGTNILGYSNDEVDEVVKSTISSGNMSTLNCVEEVDLADKLVKMHPWADQVKFTRTGGEANAVSIRIARAASGKEKVAFCGYHGWHDWYLAANLPDDSNLNNHLLPGLEAKGVPKSLRNTIFPFNFNNYDELEKIVMNHNIGVIKMEIFRNDPPEDNFLSKVRSLADLKNIVLIFDECTSGFRETYGGLHLKLNINPDMLILGKALGNGYAINAILGKKEVMKEAETTFISSTFWTERIGPTAALKTLEIMNKIKSWEKITNSGIYLREKWQEIAIKLQIELSIKGLPSLSTFFFNSPNHLAYKTYITQEMLKKNILASNVIYLCVDHSKDLIDEYLYELEKIFTIIKDCEDGRNINSLLEGPICRSGFKRLN